MFAVLPMSRDVLRGPHPPPPRQFQVRGGWALDPIEAQQGAQRMASAAPRLRFPTAC